MVGLVDDYHQKFPINSRIKLNDDFGTVKYVGEIEGYQGLWLGIEWDNPNRGKHNGTINNIKYFQTQYPKSGSMIRPGKITQFESVELAAKNRYLEQNSNVVDNELMRETQERFHAAIFEIVGMDKIGQRLNNIHELTVISVNNSLASSAGDLKSFSLLKSINLSNTLIWNWNIIGDIVKQLPTLIDIDLSNNRLILPTTNDILNLEPFFRQIKHINLSNCNYQNWSEIILTAELWPDLESLSLHENDIKTIDGAINCNKIFKNLQKLDLHKTNISNFQEICKLGNIQTLKTLLLMENGIENIELPDCDYNQKLTIFSNLEFLSIFENNLIDDCFVFNELDKLASLNYLSCSANKKTGFEEMFSSAVGLIENLKYINKLEINHESRRGAEYDIWKKYGGEWLRTETDENARKKFCKKIRSYPRIIEKYGPPPDFLRGPLIKISNLVKILIKNQLTNEIWEKKVPRKISVQTLHGLIIKKFKMENTMPILSYIDSNHPELIVQLDNLSKNLDYYSIQDNDTVLVKW